MSPTPCELRTVTCCFSTQQQFVQIYINEVDLTSQVTPQAGFTNSSVTKKITFEEPIQAAAIAIKGFENNEILYGSLMLSCRSTSPDSAWNFVSEVGTGESSWKGIKALDRRTNSFPTDWFRNVYIGQKSPADPIVDDLYEISNECGSVTTKIKPRLQSTDHYWAVRKWVNQTRCDATQALDVALLLQADDYSQDLAAVENENNNAAGLDPGVIAGIVVGALLFVGAVAMFVAQKRTGAAAAPVPKANDAANGDWSEQFDEASGTKFWVSKKTGEFSWTSPAETAAAVATHVSTLAPVQDPTAMTATENRVTSEVSYMAPAAFAPPMLATENRATGEFSYDMASRPL